MYRLVNMYIRTHIHTYIHTYRCTLLVPSVPCSSASFSSLTSVAITLAPSLAHACSDNKHLLFSSVTLPYHYLWQCRLFALNDWIICEYVQPDYLSLVTQVLQF